MSEKLKYQVGDELLVKVQIVETDDDDLFSSYQISLDNLMMTPRWFSKKHLEDVAVESQKPTVTQEVMDWYEEVKSERADWTINNWLRAINTSSEVCDWLYGENHLENQHAFATLIAYGPDAVQVKDEQKYYVLNDSGRLLLAKQGEAIEVSNSKMKNRSAKSLKKFQLTEEEIKNYDERYWAFAKKVEDLH